MPKTAAAKPKKSKAKKAILIIAIALVVLLLAMLIAIPFAVMPMFLGQRYQQEQFASAQFGIESERVTLQTQDGLALAAWRTRATEDAKGTVIILSGIQNPSVTAFFGYAKMLADEGWDSLLIEMRARSESEGEEIGFGMTEWMDVQAGVDFLDSDTDAKDLPIVAMGTSMGGGTVLIAAGQIPRIDAVIAISAFSSWSDLFVDNMSMFGMPRFLGIMDLPFINLYLGLHFGFGALQYSPINAMAQMDTRPVLMMHSTEDSQVPFSEYERLLEEADKHNVDITTFVREGDEHMMCYEEYFDDPAKDTAFSGAVLDFLDTYFP